MARVTMDMIYANRAVVPQYWKASLPPKVSFYASHDPNAGGTAGFRSAYAPVTIDRTNSSARIPRKGASVATGH